MAVAIVNQWATTFAQSLTFGQTPSALQSTVLPLNVANSVGGGSGTPTAGNWLVLIAGWNQKSLPSVTMAANDDAHAFWRPGNVNTSTWAVSPSTGNTRVAVWYTANPLNAALKAYAAPSGLMAGMAVLVVELSGTGPWDSITGINTNYAAGATTLNLALGAPSGSSFAIGAVCGDSTAAGQAFLPASWTGLHTTSATNGVDHTCDAVLTSAILLSNSGSLSVNGTASSATDLSGVLIEFLINAASPIPANQNPNWPYLKFEAAFGGGFQTPPDQLTWTDLSGRLWSWNETTGVQYQLGQIQATDMDLEIDNFDNALASDNVGSPYYSNALNSNMSFQAGISPWTRTNNATIVQSSAHVFASSSGAVAQFSLQVTPDGITATPGAISEQEAAVVGAAYSASAWFYSVAGYATGAQVAISWYNSSHTLLSTVTSGAVNIPAATWTQVTFLNQTAPASTAFAAITVQFAGTPAATAFWVAEAALVAGASAVSTGLVTTGVPIRIRAAIGTIGSSSENIPGAPVTANRWYVIQRNAEQWPQQIDSAYRRFVTLTATDIWSAMAAAETTPYRGEVLQDAPYAWWAMDDQPLPGGVQPVTLRNIAPGNANVLNITQSAAAAGTLGQGAAVPQLLWNREGWGGATAVGTPVAATSAVAQQQGWMYGDPQSVPPEFSTSAITTANPGAAAWQASGQAGTIGGEGWFLYCTDSGFPALSGGITVECWFNYQYYGSGTGYNPGSTGYPSSAGSLIVFAPTEQPVLQQPTMPLTILELATASLPVAVLQLDQNGFLNLLTYNGSTATSNSIYTGSDLRSNSWHHAAMTLTTTTWAVYVDGGATAAVSGTATGMTSAWTTLVGNGDLGTGGGSSVGLATALVQTQGNAAATASVTVPLNQPTTAGNCLVVAVTTGSGGVAGVTVSPLGTADNFTLAKAVNPGFQDAEIWVDPNCAGGQTSVVVTQGGSNTMTVNVYEFSGIVTSSPVDQTAGATGSGVAAPGIWSSGTTGTLASPSEIAIGVLSHSSTNVTFPGASWSGNWAPVTSTAGQVYSGYFTSTSLTYGAAIVTLKTIGLCHGGNVALSHLAVYPSVLPQWRIAAHYWAAFTAFGQIPAPQNLAMQWIQTGAATAGNTATDWTPDGSANNGSYQNPNGVYAAALVAAATPGGSTSGSSQETAAVGFFSSGNPTSTMWVQWTGVAPRFNVYTGPNIGAEKRAAVSSGNGSSFINGYGLGGISVQGAGGTRGTGGVNQVSGTALVQSSANVNGQVSPVTCRLNSPTTAGNCLVVVVTGTAVVPLTSITIGNPAAQSADHFASAINTSGSGVNVSIWVDPNCVGGQTDVVATWGSQNGAVTVYEFSGIVTSSPVDKTAGQNTNTTSTQPISWTSGTTAAQSQASNLAIAAAVPNSLLALTLTTTDTIQWNGGVGAAFAGLPTTAGVTFHGTANTAGSQYAAAVITLKTTWSGGSPPTAATALGDTPGQRIERCLSYGKITYPGRSIDPATLLVQAATDIGGQQTGQNILNIVRSDGGLLYIDNNGYLHYDDKIQLANELASAWTIGPASSPYYPEIRWLADPLRVWNAISITPFSPEQLTLANIGPSSSAAVNASQMQYGPQPLQFYSYLQSQSEMLTQANWLFTNYGTIRVRAENVRLDAASAPALWPQILGMNVGDPAVITMWQVGGGGLTWTMRISRIRRRIEFREKRTEASIELNLDWEPPNYWS